MAIADAGKDVIVKKTFTKPKSKIKKTKPINKAQCTICNDAKYVKSDNGGKIKCSCTIKAELKEWLDQRLQASYRGKGLELDIKADRSNLDFVLFDGIKTKTFLQLVTKDLLVSYFQKGTDTFGYYLMTGNDYTEKFVIGEANKYHTVGELFVILGLDNFNKTLHTTIYSLLVERQLKGLRTWVLTSDTKISTGSLSDLYGYSLVEFLKDSSNFSKVVKPVNKGIKR